MRTPGFNAMNALAASARPYRSAALDRRETSALQPAAAIYSGGRFICYGEVTENGFINCYPTGGGGGGVDRCRPSCGPCRADPESRTGRSRFCLRANCDVYSRPC